MPEPLANTMPTALTSADLSAFRAVRLNSSGLLAYCGADEAPDGILNDADTPSGEAASFTPWNIIAQFVGVAGGTISKGDEVETGANGQFIAQSSGVIRGIAQTDAASGERVQILRREPA